MALKATCETARDALLAGGPPAPDAAEHLRGCADCRAWRAMGDAIGGALAAEREGVVVPDFTASARRPPPAARWWIAGAAVATAGAAGLWLAPGAKPPAVNTPTVEQSEPPAARVAPVQPEAVPVADPASWDEPAPVEDDPCAAIPRDALGRAEIEEALFLGSLEEVRGAIDRAKERRGTTLGCLGRAPIAATAAARDDEVRARLEHLLSTQLGGAGACPRSGRVAAPPALGAYRAARLGVSVPAAALEAAARIAADLEASQLRPDHATVPAKVRPGVFGLADPRERPGCEQRAADLARSVERAAPEYLVRYERGARAGERFIVGDYKWPRLRSGALALAHGPALELMLEAAHAEPDPGRRARWRETALLAAAWIAEEPPVFNVAYTATDVAALARTYGAFGGTRLRDAMVALVDRALAPVLLTDEDRDGRVDGAASITFARLGPASARPGQAWNHNGDPTTQPAIADALVAAYVALRDRGDTALAARVRPLVEVALDSLTQNVLASLYAGDRSRATAVLATAVHQIARHEAVARPAWSDALAIVAAEAGALSADAAALYLASRRGAPYVPLALDR